MTLPERLPGIVAEAIFVVAYFAGAEGKRDLPSLEIFRIWAAIAFLVHPVIWRTWLPWAAYTILLGSIVPFCYFFAKRR